MNDPDEFNIALPFFLGLILCTVLALAGLLFRVLNRFNIIQISNKHYLLSVLKDAFLSLAGVFAAIATLKVFLSIIEFIYNL